MDIKWTLRFNEKLCPYLALRGNLTCHPASAVQVAGLAGAGMFGPKLEVIAFRP